MARTPSPMPRNLPAAPAKKPIMQRVLDWLERKTPLLDQPVNMQPSRAYVSRSLSGLGWSDVNIPMPPVAAPKPCPDAVIRQLADALSELAYEVTHLSPMEDDGSHRCTISAKALSKARAALMAAKFVHTIKI